MSKPNPDSLSQELDKVFYISEEVTRNYGNGKILLNRVEFNRIKALLSQEILKELEGILDLYPEDLLEVNSWAIENAIKARIAYWKEQK